MAWPSNMKAAAVGGAESTTAAEPDSILIPSELAAKGDTPNAEDRPEPEPTKSSAESEDPVC